jgi:hypothetical protein
MRAGLLHPAHDPPLRTPASLAGRAVLDDLGLQVVLDAMARGDGTVEEAARRVLLDPATDPAAIRHRQAVLRACLAHPEVVRALYGITVRTLERRKKMYWGLVRRPDAVVYHGIELIALYRRAFRELRDVVDPLGDRVGANGLGELVATLRHDLDDAFLGEVDGHVKALRFRAGIRVSARLGGANTGTGYALEPPDLRRPSAARRLVRWWRARAGLGEPEVATYRLPAYDDSGVRALSELQARGLERTANAIAHACDGVLAFFRQLRGELAFYVGCLALHERLAAIGAPVCFPDALEPATGALNARDLYDPGLALVVGTPVVGNDPAADGARLVVVTGANQGGKTTFLRSLGMAHLMMQAGMFVAAHSFRADVAAGVSTHFTREEDAAMRRGRLDEELSRLDTLVPNLRRGSLLLLNESFASTNEREGSELAAGVARALTEAGVRVVFVTHLSQFACELHEERRPGTLFLRAERLPDGTRTFRMIEGAPLRTSHGGDLYRAVVGGGAAPGREGGGAAPGREGAPAAPGD